MKTTDEHKGPLQVTILQNLSLVKSSYVPEIMWDSSVSVVGHHDDHIEVDLHVQYVNVALECDKRIKALIKLP